MIQQFIRSILVITVLGTLQLFAADYQNVSANKQSIGSSYRYNSNGYEYLVQNGNDADQNSHWESESNDNESFEIDLGSPEYIGKFKIYWEARYYATSFDILLSNDKSNWDTAERITGATGGTVEYYGNYGEYQYIKVELKTRSESSRGFSFYEFKAYATAKPELPNVAVRWFGPLKEYLENPADGDAFFHSYLNQSYIFYREVWEVFAIGETGSMGPRGYQGERGPQGPTANIDALITRIEALEAKLIHVTTVGENMYIDSANLHIRSGAGSTAGTVNARGNLIIGYNENTSGNCSRTGSHNIISGVSNCYASYAGVVFGQGNTVGGAYSTIVGGSNGTISGENSSISGGSNGTISGGSSSISGGYYNNIAGNYASISGGQQGIASGYFSSVSGGRQGTASGDHSSISGGWKGIASGTYSSISGGMQGTASGQTSSISGGQDGSAAGQGSSISGGTDGSALGDYSSISGGSQGTAEGVLSSISGGYKGHIIGGYSSISGGDKGTVDGAFANISGGTANTATGTYSSISGGYGNQANGFASSVSAGQSGQANGNHSSVNGGLLQRAEATYETKPGSY
ncbi:MAG: discoidin domain-containing protein [Fibrobacterales bacterium]